MRNASSTVADVGHEKTQAAFCLKHLRRAEPIPEEQRSERLGIADGAVEGPGDGLVPGDDMRLDPFVKLEALRSGRQLFGQEEVRAFAQDAGRRKELREFSPTPGLVAGFFFQLPVDASQREKTPYSVSVCGQKFLVLPGVFSPKYFNRPIRRHF